MGSEQKYKQGDVVRDTSGGKNVILQVRDNDVIVSYFNESPNHRFGWSAPVSMDIDDIDGPWREPLRAEFECEWEMRDLRPIVRQNYDPSIIEFNNYAVPMGKDIRNKLKPFIDKRTKVTIEEIV